MQVDLDLGDLSWSSRATRFSPRRTPPSRGIVRWWQAWKSPWPIRWCRRAATDVVLCSASRPDVARKPGDKSSGIAATGKDSPADAGEVHGKVVPGMEKPPATADGENKPGAEQGRLDQIVKLLKLDREEAADHVTATDGNGQQMQFTRSKAETVDNLRKAGGEPDKVNNVQIRSKDPGQQPASWKMHIWGPVLVLADETGHARFYYLTKDYVPGKKSVEEQAPAKTEPAPSSDSTPPATESKPKTETPGKKPDKKAPEKDDEKDVF